MNLVLDPLLDFDHYKHINNPKSRYLLLEIMNSFNLRDTFRLFHPLVRRYTWRRKNPVRQARLDYFLVSHTMCDIITSCCINPSYRSDHSSIQIKILLNKFERGKGLWKFNCSLLKEQEYIDLVNSIIQEEKYKYALPVYNLRYLDIAPDVDVSFTVNDGQFLELLLLRIRGETIKFASYRKKEANKHENRLKYEIKFLENIGNLALAEIIDIKKLELENIRQKSTIGSAIRARTQWRNEGEKPSKFFCSLKKYNYTEKTIKSIQLQDGQSITDQKKILEQIKNFYSSLFSEKKHKIKI